MRKLMWVLPALACLGCGAAIPGPPAPAYTPNASGTDRYDMRVAARSDLGIFERVYVIHVRDARTGRTHAFLLTETGNARTMVKFEEWADPDAAREGER